MRRRGVKSSVIESIGYDAESYILEIEFKDSRDVWQYLSFKPTAYKKFVNSVSFGNFFATRIKGKYTEKKIL